MFMRLVGVICGTALCLCLIWIAGTAGLSRMFGEYARRARLLAPADRAARLSPNDPLAHITLGLVLRSQGNWDGALKEFERAAALRPRDYVIWYELALARSAAGDREGAILACEQAVRLAPHYSRTHWLLGNMLYRAGRREEAFAELRRAAASDAESLPSLIDLAWGATGGDAPSVEALVQPQTNPARLALAHFFARKGKYAEVITLFRAVGDASEADRQKLLTELLSARRFEEAYEVWSTGRQGRVGESIGGRERITDPGFEGTIKLNEQGFGWRQPAGVDNVRILLDTTNPHTGTRSIAIEFNGNSNPSSPVLSQAVLIEPDTRYRLSFAARAEEVVTGGLPQVTVSEYPVSESERLLNSVVLRATTGTWHDYSTEFTTGKETGAIIINLNRQNCSSSPCPAFGRVWLDDFSLQKLAHQ